MGNNLKIFRETRDLEKSETSYKKLNEKQRRIVRNKLRNNLKRFRKTRDLEKSEIS